MKFLKYVESLFVPSKMGQRKNISVFVTILILILASYLIAIPYMTTFQKRAYEVYRDAPSYNFNVLDKEKSEEAAWTDEEKAKDNFKDKCATYDDIKALNFKVEGGTFIIPNGIESLKNVPYNGKEFLLKRNVFKYDKDGTKLDETDTYYVHIVFDLFDNLDDAHYTIDDDFDKKFNHTDEKHFLYVFYYDGIAYRNEYMIDKNQRSFGYAYSKVGMNFEEMDNIEYLARKVSDILVPQTKTLYTFNGFIYTVICPIILCLVAMVFIRKKNVLTSFKHYFNIAGLCTIPVSIIFFALEWIPFMIRIGLMELYWLIFGIYYFVVLSIINKTERIE